MANRWSMNASYAYNDAVEDFDTAASRRSDLRRRTSARATPDYAPESGGSGIGNVFQNAKWLVKVNGRVQLPWEFNLAANYAEPPGLPVPAVDPDAEPRQRRRPGPGAPRPDGRRALRQHVHD